MSTISTEQAKDLRNAFECWQEDYDPVEDKEQYEMFGLGVVVIDELLALRKERERAEPVVKAAEKLVRCKGRYHSEQNYRALAALFGVSTPDLPPLEADTTSQQLESLAGKAVGGWIPCSERMPDFYYSCLAADEHGDMVIGLPSNLEVSDRKAFCLSNGELFLATHWQPLPEPPCK